MKNISIAAVGDIMLGSTWPPPGALPPCDGHDILKPVSATLRAADLAFGNLEGALANDGEPTKRTGPNSYAFRTPTRYARALKAAGFGVLSLANNHAGDFGAPGRQSTRNALNAVGIAHAGDRGTVARLDVRGCRVHMVAFATNNVSHNLNEIASARKAVAAARGGADILIVSFHGGAEGASREQVPHGPEIFLGQPRGDLRRFCRAVVEAGADLVLGHGPHVARGMEVYRGRLIAYSLGNFATYAQFNLKGPLGLAPILVAELAPDGAIVGGHLHAFRQDPPGGPQPDPRREVVARVRHLSQTDFGRSAVRIAPDGSLTPP